MWRSFSMMAVVAIFTAGSARAEACRVDPFSAPFGSDADVHMVVRSGQVCGVRMQMGLQYRSVAAGGNTSMLISEPATYGTASAPDLHSWAYVSKPGFVGKDRFVVESTGETMARYVRRGTSHYTVDVDVVR